MRVEMSDTITYSIQIPVDDDGYLGRECPKAECLGYFKVVPGTGLPGNDCTCPYCGYRAPSNQFYTPEQVAYGKSVALNRITGELLKDLKKGIERSIPRRKGGLFSISITVTGKPQPIHYYREKALEQRIACNTCTLRYAIYGVFGHCPDCGEHNSRQILDANFAVVESMIDLADHAPEALRPRLVEIALSESISAFDGFARNLMVAARVHPSAKELQTLSFQSIDLARDRLRAILDVDFAASLSETDWKALLIAFQKRHALSHRMGIIDEKYIAKTGVPKAHLGRRVTVTPPEARRVNATLRSLAGDLLQLLPIAERGA